MIIMPFQPYYVLTNKIIRLFCHMIKNRHLKFDHLKIFWSGLSCMHCIIFIKNKYLIKYI